MDIRISKALKGLGRIVSAVTAPPARRRTAPSRRSAPPRPSARQVAPGERHLVYSPELDGRADPGEIVWSWVAYEDDPSRGKDRPVLIVGRSGATLLALMLSSQDEHAAERNWLTLGAGDWDRSGRASWIRLDRVLRLQESAVRREGAILDRPLFDQVAGALRHDYGWD